MTNNRKPKAFAVNLENNATQIDKPSKPKSLKPTEVIIEESDFLETDVDDIADEVEISEKKGWGLFRWFSVALALFFSLIVGLAFEQMIADLYNRNIWIGRIGLGIFLFLGFILLILIIREWRALRKLQNLSHIRDEITSNGKTASLIQAHKLGGDVMTLYKDRQSHKSIITKLKSQQNDVMDGVDYLKLVENNIMSSLDEQAHRLITQSAKRVSVVTAVNPRAFIDMLFVGFEALRLIRKLAHVYGGKSHTMAMWRLMRLAFSNMAISGGLALTDGLASQLFGHGLASKLSAKFGEGVLNGLLVVRLGLSTQAILRPMPYSALPQPKASDFLLSIWRQSGID